MDDLGISAVAVIAFLIFLALIAIIPAAIASNKGRSFLIWWVYGALLWIIAMIHALVVEPARTCPYCAEFLREEATVCPHCQRTTATADAFTTMEGIKSCPFCAEAILSAAVKCKYCGSEVPVVPQKSDEDRMAELGITFDGKKYIFRDFQYDNLADAIRHALRFPGAA